jgi:hypothetical protein
MQENSCKVRMFCLFLTFNMTYSLWCYLQYTFYCDAVMLLENGVVLIKLNILYAEYECNMQGWELRICIPFCTVTKVILFTR